MSRWSAAVASFASDIIGLAGKALASLGLIEPEQSHQAPSLAQVVEDARREYLCALDYFQNVTDPDLVDGAAYAVKAAEKRYNYLLRKVREERGITRPA